MDDWTEGYVADLGYTYGYYSELNPVRVALAFLSAGLAPPKFATACELGFGQGLSVNIHAAAGSCGWWGTDFNPAQAAFARDLGSQGGQPALFDQAFDEFCKRSDLPEFDYIGLHGIWSWVSDDNRRLIVDFIRRKLKVGGVVYVSYNTMPGWAAFAPMRGLLTAHSDAMGAPGRGRVQRIDDALAFADKLLAASPGYLRANPQVAERLLKVKEHNRNYLAHEYFNRDWEPMSFERMSRWLEQAKLSFACSAHFPDLVESVNLTPEQQALLRGIPDPGFRETVKDFCVNQQFRKDYWVRGGRRITPGEQMDSLRSLRIVLGQPRASVSLKVSSGLGVAALQESIYAPMLDILGDHLPHSLGDVVDRLRGTANAAQVMQAAALLAGNGALFPVQADADIAAAQPRVARLNAFICARARYGGDMSHLASPLTGGGHPVDRFGQVFLAAHQAGRQTVAELVKEGWSLLSSQGQRLVKAGKPLPTEAENLAELTVMARNFLEQQLPLWRALRIA